MYYNGVKIGAFTANNILGAIIKSLKGDYSTELLTTNDMYIQLVPKVLEHFL